MFARYGSSFGGAKLLNSSLSLLLKDKLTAPTSLQLLLGGSREGSAMQQQKFHIGREGM